MNIKSGHCCAVLRTLDEDYKAAAKIVELYGERYLSGFLRIHEELEKRRSLEDAKSLALEVAKRL